ncbi:MAG: hypothetical protein VYD19_02380 [Myxococcota bacterium]|nr:hypothetical protein [Myxococcota bacterium]
MNFCVNGVLSDLICAFDRCEEVSAILGCRRPPPSPLPPPNICEGLEDHNDPVQLCGAVSACYADQCGF